MMEYHKHINTLPVANWFEMVKTGNVAYLLKCDFFSVPELGTLTPDEALLLLGIYENMPYQFDNIDGEMVEMERQISLFKMKYISTEDPQYKTQAKILEAKKIKKISELSNQKEISLIDQTAILNVNLKLNIDIYACSTSLWFSYRNMFIKQNKNEKAT